MKSNLTFLAILLISSCFLSATDAGGQARAQLMKELKINDTERRIKEAKATITSLQEKFAKDKKAWEDAKRARGVMDFKPTQEAAP